MKTCIKCNTSKPKEEFGKHKRAADGLQSRCKICKRAYEKAYFYKNQERCQGRINRFNRQQQKKTRLLIDQLKDRPCADCKQKFNPWQMDFDHLDPKTKKTEVSKLAKGSYSLNTVIKEAEKCEVVCANCHRNRTHYRSIVPSERIELPTSELQGQRSTTEL